MADRRSAAPGIGGVSSICEGSSARYVMWPMRHAEPALATRPLGPCEERSACPTIGSRSGHTSSDRRFRRGADPRSDAGAGPAKAHFVHKLPHRLRLSGRRRPHHHRPGGAQSRPRCMTGMPSAYPASETVRLRTHCAAFEIAVRRGGISGLPRHARGETLPRCRRMPRRVPRARGGQA